VLLLLNYGDLLPPTLGLDHRSLVIVVVRQVSLPGLLDEDLAVVDCRVHLLDAVHFVQVDDQGHEAGVEILRTMAHLGTRKVRQAGDHARIIVPPRVSTLESR